MAETHLLMFVIPFATNVWWTKSWLMDPVTQRWRFAVSALAGAIAWVYLAYTATRVVDASGGVQIVYGSQALAVFCAFMAFVSVIGIILGLLMWTEEAGEDTVGELRRRTGRGTRGLPDD